MSPTVRACRVARVTLAAPLHEVALAWSDAHVVLLDSADTAPGRGRWSILGVDPVEIVRGGTLRELAARLVRPAAVQLDDDARGLPFRGGALGTFGYGLVHGLEPVVPAAARDDLPVPALHVIVCEHAVVVDHHAGDAAWLVANGYGATEGAARADADARLAALRARIAATVVPAGAEVTPRARGGRLSEAALRDRGFVPELDAAAYRARVATAREHVLRGDLYEVTLSNRFVCRGDVPGPALYRALRRVSAAPFAAYVRAPGLELLSASPERFLRVDADRVASTSPIKGTRPRGATPADDARLAGELLASAKDRAENVMAVDVARNDLGRVCEPGSVTVPSLHAVASFSHTHQLVSTVCGRVRAGVGALDVVAAAFPGASMTGAPKVAAMRLIAALEPVARGPFAGALGYVDFDGTCDLNIVIRTFVNQPGALSFHVGGAIVADSDPHDEHQETLDKAAGLIAAYDALRSAGPSAPS